MADKQEPAWFEYLRARQRLINEWRTEGKSCEEIVRLLTPDVGQVWLISQVETEPPPESVVQNIIEVRDRFHAAALKAEEPPCEG